MGICAKHDWASLGAERCPGCVGDEALQKRWLAAALESSVASPTDEQAYGTELGVLRTVLQQKEARIDELCALAEMLTQERNEAQSALAAALARVNHLEHATRTMVADTLSAMNDLLRVCPRDTRERVAAILRALTDQARQAGINMEPLP
jgi:hypothetical protein